MPLVSVWFVSTLIGLLASAGLRREKPIPYETDFGGHNGGGSSRLGNLEPQDVPGEPPTLPLVFSVAGADVASAESGTDDGCCC